MVRERPRERPAGRIKFLVCIDDSEECRTALRFACMRAQNTGGKVSLVYVIEPNDFNLSGSVQEIMAEEARDRARPRWRVRGKVFGRSVSARRMAVRGGRRQTRSDDHRDDESSTLWFGARSEGRSNVCLLPVGQ